MTASSSGRVYGGVSGEVRVAGRRRKLVEAGLNLFGGDNPSTVRIKDICSEAGLTERYFYESFSDMDALFDAVVEQIMQEIESHVATALEAAPEDNLTRGRVAQRQAIDSLLSDPRKIRVLYVESPGRGGAASHPHDLNVRGAGNFLAWARSDGRFDGSSVEDRMKALAAAGAGSELLVSWVEGLIKIDADELANYLIELREHILLHETSIGTLKRKRRTKRRRT